MGRQVAVVLYVAAMVAVIVGVDFVFFRNRFWERLTVNKVLRRFEDRLARLESKVDAGAKRWKALLAG